MDIYETTSFLFPWLIVHRKKLLGVQHLNLSFIDELLFGFRTGSKIRYSFSDSEFSSCAVFSGKVGDRLICIKEGRKEERLYIKSPVRLLGFPLFYRGLLFRTCNGSHKIPGTNTTISKYCVGLRMDYEDSHKENSLSAIRKVLG